MEMLYNLGISDNELKNMVEQVPSIMDMDNEEINEKIGILTYVGCKERHIKNILSSNPYYLDRLTDDVLRLIAYLKEIGVSTLYLLFDSNPYILNKDAFEIREYVDHRIKNGDSLEDIVDDIENNPYIIDEA